MENERLTLKAKRAEKKERIETLRIRANSMVVQVRRALGGQYIDDILAIDVGEASVVMDDLVEVKEEADELKEQIAKINQLLGDG